MNKQQIFMVIVLVIGLAYCSSQGSNKSTTSAEDQYFQDVADQAKSDWEIEQDAEKFNNYIEEQNNIERQSNSATDIIDFIGNSDMIGAC